MYLGIVNYVPVPRESTTRVVFDDGVQFFELRRWNRKSKVPLVTLTYLLLRLPGPSVHLCFFLVGCAGYSMTELEAFCKRSGECCPDASQLFAYSPLNSMQTDEDAAAHFCWKRIKVLMSSILSLLPCLQVMSNESVVLLFCTEESDASASSDEYPDASDILSAFSLPRVSPPVSLPASPPSSPPRLPSGSPPDVDVSADVAVPDVPPAQMPPRPGITWRERWEIKRKAQRSYKATLEKHLSEYVGELAVLAGGRKNLQKILWTMFYVGIGSQRRLKVIGSHGIRAPRVRFPFVMALESCLRSVV